MTYIATLLIFATAHLSNSYAGYLPNCHNPRNRGDESWCQNHGGTRQVQCHGRDFNLRAFLGQDPQGAPIASISDGNDSSVTAITTRGPVESLRCYTSNEMVKCEGQWRSDKSPLFVTFKTTREGIAVAAFNRSPLTTGSLISIPCN